MKRHSIHIGINCYEDKAIVDLPFCTADARLLSSFFKDVAGYESVSVLANPTRNAILDAVAGVASRLRAGDLLVFSYSGHGFQSNDRHCLCGSDARMQLIQASSDGIPLSLLKDIVQGAGCEAVFFIDACPSEGRGPRGFSSIIEEAEPCERNLGFVAPSKTEGASFAILYPECAIDSTALGHGVFTAALDRALREAHGAGNASLYHGCELAKKHMEVICRDLPVPFPGVGMMSSLSDVNLW